MRLELTSNTATSEQFRDGLKTHLVTQEVEECINFKH